MIPKVDFNIEKLSKTVSDIDGKIQAFGERTNNLQESFERSKAPDIKKFSEAVLGKLNKIESGMNPNDRSKSLKKTLQETSRQKHGP